jgi:uncharacterized protein
MLDDAMVTTVPDDARISFRALCGYSLTAALLIALSFGLTILVRLAVFSRIPLPVEGQPFPIEDWMLYAAMAFVLLAAYWAQRRFIERRPLTELAPHRALPELLLGAAAGIGLVVLIVILLWAAGAYRLAGLRGGSVLAAPALMAVGAGLSEEVLMRGFVLGLLQRWAGSAVALVLSALLFGVLHFDNAGAGLWPVVVLVLGPGMALAAAYLMTGRLWLSIGLHAGWNFGQSGLFGLVDSGTRFPSLLDASVEGAYWLTGGAFGPEASVPCFLLWVLVGLVLLTVAVRRGRFIPFRSPI